MKRNVRNIARTLGLLFLLLGSLFRWLLHPTPTIGPDLFDGLNGALYGVAIGCLLVSLRPERPQPTT